MIDAYADVPLGELALGEILATVTAAMSRHRLKLPADLLLLIKAVDRASNRLSFAIVIAAIVVASALVILAGSGPRVLGYTALGVAGFVVAAVLGLGLAVGILRSGRL